MATRVLNRRAMRETSDHAGRVEQTSPAEGKIKKPRARKPAAEKPAKTPPGPRARKRAVKVPPRMFAHWAVCDNGMKRVAVFEYRDRAGADAKLTEMRERKPGTYCLLLVKDPYDPPTQAPEPAPADAVSQ